MAAKKLGIFSDPLLDRQLGEIVREFSPESWIEPTLTSPFTNFGSPYYDAGYYKHLGQVYLRGLISANSAASGSTIFTLPDNYYPPKDYLIPSVGSFGGTTGYAPVTIAIRSSGSVQAYWTVTSPASPSWLELDGLSFRVA